MPWGISHEYKFIFVHIPKTAGTTICSSWDGAALKQICKQTGILGGTHKTALQLREGYPKEWSEYTKFTVVRNPYDRFVSGFFFTALEPHKEFYTVWDDKRAECLLPQLYWITDRKPAFRPSTPYDRVDLHSGNILVDRILHYENLNEELGQFFEEKGIPARSDILPHFRRTIGKGAFTQYYTQEFMSLVTYLYREDLERLKYQWKGPEPEISDLVKQVYRDTYVRDHTDIDGAGA